MPTARSGLSFRCRRGWHRLAPLWILVWLVGAVVSAAALPSVAGAAVLTAGPAAALWSQVPQQPAPFRGPFVLGQGGGGGQVAVRAASSAPDRVGRPSPQRPGPSVTTAIDLVHRGTVVPVEAPVLLWRTSGRDHYRATGPPHL